MRYKQLYRLLAAFLCISFILQTSAIAGPFVKNARITGMTVKSDKGEMVLSLKVNGAFNERLGEAVLSGAPTTFSFFIIVSEFRAILPDKKILQLNVTHKIKYDNLRNDFTVKRSWEGNKPMTTDSFGQAKKWMTEITDLKLMPLSDLQKGTHYRIKAKAELDKVTLPRFLNYIFFFASLWNFETDWHTVKFNY